MDNIGRPRVAILKHMFLLNEHRRNRTSAKLHRVTCKLLRRISIVCWNCNLLLLQLGSYIKDIIRSYILLNPNVERKMGDKDVWFDGVNKKLLAAHTVEAKEVIEGDSQTLVTVTPLNLLSSQKPKTKIAPKRKSKTADQAQAKDKKSTKLNGREKTAKALIKPHKGVTDELAIDCEMVECYRHKSVLARVSVVNLFGHPILDRCVAPPAAVTDYRTRYSGIRPKDLVDAPDFESVQKDVKDLIQGKIVVGHAIHNDFDVLKITHPPELTRDTSVYFRFLFQGKTPSLKKLTESLLRVKIQKGEHDSVQDAQATMKLYVKSKPSQPRQSQKQKPKKKKKMKTFYVLTD